MPVVHVSRQSRWASLPPLELTSLAEQAGIELPTPVDDATAHALLRHGDLEIIGRMPWSSNATFLCTVTAGNREDDDRLFGVDPDASMLAIYKPRVGERPLWDFHEGTLCQREAAACLVSELLGWNLVPDTVLRDGPVEIGAVSRFYDHDPEQHYFETLSGNEATYRRFAAFDVIVNNTDRKGGHVLLADDGHLWGIDHGVCFHEQYKLRTVIWEFAGEQIEPAIIGDIERFAAAIDNGDGPAAELQSLLTPAEFEALRTRTFRLLERSTYPVPSGDYRDYPWPTI